MTDREHHDRKAQHRKAQSRHTRRTMLQGATALGLASVLATPALRAKAAAGLETVSMSLPEGKQVNAAFAPAAREGRPSILLIHEWWGLNDQIKTMAAAFAAEGYNALAVDLYGGKAAADGDREAARSLMLAVNPATARATLGAWINWLMSRDGASDKIATCGWCFGGAWSLNTSLLRPVDATVVYYGDVARDAKALSALKGPVLGHFATQDGYINADMVSSFVAAMNEAAKDYEIHWYEADHAFANPTSARYDEGDAALAWTRTLDFLDDQFAA